MRFEIALPQSPYKKYAETPYQYAEIPQQNTPSKNTPLSGGIRNASGLKTPPTRDAARDRKAQMHEHQRMKKYVGLEV